MLSKYSYFLHENFDLSTNNNIFVVELINGFEYGFLLL